MPDPLPRAEMLHATLADLGVTHVLGVPDNGSAALFERCAQDPGLTLLTVTREGEAFAIASGLWLGGKRPVVLIQNTGLLESGDSLRGTAVRMGVPLLCLIGYRGYAKMKAHAIDSHTGTPDRETMIRNDIDSVALLTEPTLNAWGIPYHLYANDNAPCITQAWTQAHQEERPIALLLTKPLV